MPNKIKNPLFRNLMYASILISLSLLLITAGCVDSVTKNVPQKNTTETPVSTCSAEANVCTLDLPESLRIDASPQLYTPLMSSTVGIGLTPNASGLSSTGTEYEWNATYGHFLDWSAPAYTVNRLSNPVVSHGETIYWSFMEAPEYPPEPVVISVTAREVISKKPIANSRLTLGWKNNLTVFVEKNE